MTTLYVKAYTQQIYDHTTSLNVTLVFYSTPNVYNTLPIQSFGVVNGTTNLLATPYPTFDTEATLIAQYGAAQCAALVSQVNTTYGATVYTTYDLETVDAPVLSAIDALALVARTGIYADLTGKPSLFSGSYLDLTNKPTIPSFSAQAHIADGATNAADNATTNSVTTYNTLSGLLGIANGLNSANSAQNDLATKYNDLADKHNDLATKFNTLLAHLVTLGFQG